MRIRLLTACCLLVILGNAQQALEIRRIDSRGNVYNVVNGEPVSLYKYVHVVSGSPFLDTAWLPGTVTTQTGKHAGNIWLKLDLLDQEVYYKDPLGNELVSTTPLAEITLTRPDGETLQFEYVHRQVASPKQQALNGWLQLLQAGKWLSLYKRIDKQVHENKPYGSAIAEITIRTRETFLAFAAGRWQVCRNWQDLLALLPPERQTEFKNLAKERNWQFGAETDMAEWVAEINRALR